MSARKSLVIDARMLNSGGIGTYLRQLIPFLSEVFSVTVLVRDFQPQSISFEQIECDVPIYSLKEQFLLPLYIPRCDFFFSPHYNIPILPIRARKRLVTIHDVFHLAHFSTLKLSERAYAKFVISQAIRKSDLIFTVSNFSYEEILHFTDADPLKIRVIPLASFQGLQCLDDFENLQEKYGIPNSYFLFVGNVKPHKNLKGILHSYLKFPELSPLMVVGNREGLLNPDDLDELFDEYPELCQKVHFLGPLSSCDLSLLYQNAIALVFPSFYESFGLPPLEAMQWECPVIASNRAGIVEVCAEAVQYIDPHRPETIADAMMQMAKNRLLRQKYIQSGKERIKKFSWEQTAEKTIKAIEELL